MGWIRDFALVPLVSVTAAAQITLAGGGYVSPQPVQVAPGQLTIFYITGLNSIGNSAASELPLPAALNGISATLHQTLPAGSFPAPLLALNQTNICTGEPAPDVPECTLTALTVQIPYELFARNPLMDNIATGITDITFAYSGSPGRSFAISPVLDNIHVITDCDQQAFAGIGRSSCPSVVTHVDGSRVTAAAPARAGEIVVAYAFGLGRTDPTAKAGQAAGPNQRVSGPIALDFEFLPNAAALEPRTRPGFSPVGVTPEFAGLTPGFAGLYQVNLRVPAVPDGTPGCGDGIDSNLTVRIQGLVSYDGARICATN